MKYEVRIDDNVLKVRIAGNHTIWMHRSSRSQTTESKPGVYILVDERGYCCYVGETDNIKERISTHESRDQFCWWTHTIYFWDANPSSAFSSTDDRRWFEKQMKVAVEPRHPTFTKAVQNKPEPDSGSEVLSEMLALLNVIGFETMLQSPPSPPPPQQLPPPQSSEEPTPHKNHHPPLGDWPTYTALAKAIADKNGKPGTAGGIQQKLTNYWVPSRLRYVKANATTRKMLESFKIVFDSEGFVKSCANVPNPLS